MTCRTSSGFLPDGTPIAVALAFAIALGACREPKESSRPSPPPDPPMTRIACVGDSITHGWSLENRKQNCYPAVLGEILGDDGYVVRGFSASGATVLSEGDIPWRAEPKHAASLAFGPDIVVVMLGTNDVKPHNWAHAESFVDDYAGLVREWKALPSRPEVLLCLPVPAFPENFEIRNGQIRDALIPRIRKVASETACPLVDLYDRFEHKGYLFPDKIHPSVEGSREIAKEVARALGKFDGDRIEVARDGAGFVTSRTDQPFEPWGFNYDHDGEGRLIEDYWEEEWETVVEDFREMAELGANVARIHLQLGRIMKTPEETHAPSLRRLEMLLELAEETGIHLDLTGLGCYHRNDVPIWYDPIPEEERWKVQERFWSAVARTCRNSHAVFCYDLMNEPILPGANKPESDWLAGAFAGKHFVQRIALDLEGRSRGEVAEAWVARMVAAIREHDSRSLVTVGVIPWSHVWPNARPIFYAPEVAGHLDFVSVHLYPKDDDVEKAMKALAVYDIGKPMVIEEIFPLKSSIAATAEFIGASRAHADGWISFYWGQTPEDYANATDLKDAITRDWLTTFRTMAPRYRPK